MVNCRDLHAWLKKAYTVRLKRHRQEIEVRRVTQQILMYTQIGGQGAVSPEPHQARRIGHMTF